MTIQSCSFRLLLLALFLLGGCGKNNETSVASPPPVVISGPFPLMVGNNWTYKLTSFDTSGVALGAPADFVYQVISDSTVFNEKWYYLSGALYYVNRSDGVWRVLNGTPVLFLKYPASVNDSYSSSLGRLRVMSTGTTITVPKGTYSCYQYRLSQANGSQFDYYFLEGIGFVRIDVFEQTLGGRTYIMSQYALAGYVIN
jgi:hypothetical protein